MPPRKRAAAKKKATPEITDPALAKVVDLAQPAPNDLETMLEEYEQLVQAAREPADNKARREELKALIVSRLKDEGPRYYLDESGAKRYAWETTPETVNLDVSKVVEYDENGEIQLGLIDKIAPRQLSREGLRSAISSGALTPEQVKEAVSITPQTPRIYTRLIDEDTGE